MRKALAEGIAVALQMGKPVPVGAQDAHMLAMTGCRPTFDELEAMPQKLVDSIVL